jgi:hypothetical protein
MGGRSLISREADNRLALTRHRVPLFRQRQAGSTDEPTLVRSIAEPGRKGTDSEE